MLLQTTRASRTTYRFNGLLSFRSLGDHSVQDNVRVDGYVFDDDVHIPRYPRFGTYGPYILRVLPDMNERSILTLCLVVGS